jgi:adenylate cyclase, class 2
VKTPETSATRYEIEIKLPVQDLAAVREKLRADGARQLTEPHSESNDLYDQVDGSVAKSGRVLRLRRTEHGATLTYKGPARFEDGAKTREERETAVSDPNEMESILAALGFHRRFRYEKRREEWSLDDCVIALDETPIGTFAEVEGDPAAIRRVLQQLGLDPAESLPYSYTELYARRRRDDPTLPADMLLDPPP